MFYVFPCVNVSRLAGGKMCRWCMVHHCFTMHDAKKHEICRKSFFQSGLMVTKKLFPVFIIISGKIFWGEAVHMLGNTCAILGKYTYTCVSIPRERNDIKFANTKRSLITCTYKNTKEKLPKENAAILHNKKRKANRNTGCLVSNVHILCCAGFTIQLRSRKICVFIS